MDIKKSNWLLRMGLKIYWLLRIDQRTNYNWLLRTGYPIQALLNIYQEL